MEQQLPLFRRLGFSTKPNAVYPLAEGQNYCEVIDPDSDIVIHRGYPDTSFLGGKLMDLSCSVADIISNYGRISRWNIGKDIFGDSEVSLGSFSFLSEFEVPEGLEDLAIEKRSLSHRNVRVFGEEFQTDWDTRYVTLTDYSPGEWEKELDGLYIYLGI